MESIQVALENKGYSIYIGEGVLDNLRDLIKNGNKWMIITDYNVDALYGSQVEKIFSGSNLFKYVVQHGEESKTPHTVTKIMTELVRYQFTRNDKIIALGGGVIGDLAGFCASVYMRGISFIQIPTTLLAQVDSSVGGKTGVNLPEAKNIMGSFHQPELVIADTVLLKTLPSREVISGLGEVIKYGIIEDYELLIYLKTQIEKMFSIDQQVLPYVVKRCCEIKAYIVSEDEKEKGLRKNLNFGHTIGHALETATKYKKYTHGEAVIMGMFYESKMAKIMGLINEEYFSEITGCIKATGVPLGIEWTTKEELVKIMGRDKKNQSNRVSFILPVGKGSVKEFLLLESESLKILGKIMEG